MFKAVGNFSTQPSQNETKTVNSDFNKNNTKIFVKYFNKNIVMLTTQVVFRLVDLKNTPN